MNSLLLSLESDFLTFLLDFDSDFIGTCLLNIILWAVYFLFVSGAMPSPI